MKKRFFIIAMVILLGILAALIVIGIRSSRKNDDLFADSEYPISYTIKNGIITIKLDGHRTPDLPWEVRIADESIVSVTQKSSGRDTKDTYIVMPKAAGTTRVNFVKSMNISGTAVEIANINLPLYITSSGNSFDTSCLEEPYLVKGPEVISEGSDHPVILNDTGALMGDIYFVNGKGDWTLDSPDGVAVFDYKSDNGNDYVNITRGSASGDGTSEGAVVNNSEIILSSSSLKKNEKLKVTYNNDGSVSLSRVTTN
ncbi:MAG: hypothetical protein J5517_04845 [Eubacterium sp.]|nr:hypothetical protein [Eubacterium sp.]